jgi:hypothetical protein
MMQLQRERPTLPIAEPAQAAALVEESSLDQATLYVAAVATGAGEQNIDRHLVRSGHDRATLLGGMPRVGREAEVCCALSDSVALVVVGLDDFPVVSTPKSRIWRSDSSAVVGDGALRDAKLTSDLRL